MEDMGKPLVQF